MYKYLKIFLLSVLFISSATFVEPVSTATSPTGDSMFYYRLGGGRVFRAVPRWEVTTINLSLRGTLTGLTCGGFDPKVTIANTMNRVKDGLEDMYAQMEAAASAAVANLPGYILSKINPNLYDLFMNSIAQAETRFSLATKSCEKIEAEIRNGGDPFEEFMTVSIGDTWKAGVGTNGVDIVDLEEQAESEARNNGLAHPCHGRAGGLNQPNFEVLGDVSEVGYNRLLNRSACLTSNITVTPSVPPLVQKFNSPGAVRTWVNQVVGEVSVDVSVNGDPSSTPGAGLLPKINSRKDEVYAKLEDLYEGSSDLTLANLKEVSAPGVLITAQVIEGMRTLSPQDAQIFMARIADEVGVADTIDSALLVRRTLATGQRETEFFANNSVQKHSNKAISEIDKEIDLVMKENEVRKKLLGESVPLLLNMVRAKETTSLLEVPVHPQSERKLRDGSVKN
ncbi:integrating conjugative element protein [Aliikangiella maris]|uniref:Integrating conjugative element protein n=2 Tax=Aliikangiella maris TaxID=3162458 RepID=A0ABV3MTW2_9GAMM